jgi:pyruvate/2-oxoglutarate/acetoin dehydrogenase E1 component
MTKELTYTQAINEALHESMDADKSVIVFGLGVDDPKRIFGTTAGLKESYGESRVFDVPTAENAMTGFGIGAALGGLRPVMVHQRLDFFLLAMDQLVNGAAKWHFMFGGAASVPITVRLIVGRGWGQGPTHSQNLQAWFAHIPGLKVMMPTFPGDAKALLKESINDNNPVVFIEHRWLHNLRGNVDDVDTVTSLGKSKVIREGKHGTIVGMSYMTIEALRAVDHLKKFGIEMELIDLISLNPIDWPLIFKSLKKTGNLIVLDTGTETCNVAGEIIAKCSENCWPSLKTAPKRLCPPNFPEATSVNLTKNYHPTAIDIVKAVNDQLGNSFPFDALINSNPHDVPGDWFKGPF